MKKKILIHLFFWSVYILLWSARDIVYHPSFFNNVSANILFTSTVVPFIYFNLYFLVPRYLLTRKIGLYALLLLSGITVFFFTRRYTYILMFEEFLKVQETADMFKSLQGAVIIMSENLVLITLSMALFLIDRYYIQEGYAKEIERKQIKTELDLLKQQIQPHFMFNILNSIYLLIEKDMVLAKEVLLKFSEVLSHQLYNARQDKVDLGEELTYLRNYVELEKLRQEDFLDLVYDFPEGVGQLKLAPMILITFIENAFKHSIDPDGFKISINIKVENNVLSMSVTNTIGTLERREKGGIGLENVKRRLDLIYGDDYVLDMSQQKGEYKVLLTLKLDANNG